MAQDDHATVGRKTLRRSLLPVLLAVVAVDFPVLYCGAVSGNDLTSVVGLAVIGAVAFAALIMP